MCNPDLAEEFWFGRRNSLNTFLRGILHVTFVNSFIPSLVNSLILSFFHSLIHGLLGRKGQNLCAFRFFMVPLHSQIVNEMEDAENP